jgi:hypothetical protein
VAADDVDVVKRVHEDALLRRHALGHGGQQPLAWHLLHGRPHRLHQRLALVGRGRRHEDLGVIAARLAEV